MTKLRYYVVFETSFRGDSQPCISHETASTTAGEGKTYCGRNVADAATFEPDGNDLDPDCNICRRKARRLKETT